MTFSKEHLSPDRAGLWGWTALLVFSSLGDLDRGFGTLFRRKFLPSSTGVGSWDAAAVDPPFVTKQRNWRLERRSRFPLPALINPCDALNVHGDIATFILFFFCFADSAAVIDGVKEVCADPSAGSISLIRTIASIGLNFLRISSTGIFNVSAQDQSNKITITFDELTHKWFWVRK